MDGLAAVRYSVHNSRVDCTGPVWPFADRSGGACDVMGHLRQPSASTFRPRNPSTAAPRKVAIRSPPLHAAIRVWHHLAPALAVVMAGAGAVAVGRVWSPTAGTAASAASCRRRSFSPPDSAPAVVVGEVHHLGRRPRGCRAPVARHSGTRSLHGILVCGASGSGKTSACHAPGRAPAPRLAGR